MRVGARESDGGDRPLIRLAQVFERHQVSGLCRQVILGWRREHPGATRVDVRSDVNHADSFPKPETYNTYILNIPKFVSSAGAFAAAERPRARTIRVSTGSMIPSSQSLAVEWYGLPSSSYFSRIGALKSSRSSSVITLSSRRRPSSCTVRRTFAACWPPITLMRALGHIHKKRGEYALPHIP